MQNIMYDSAKSIIKNAFAPYSKIKIAAAVRSASGKIYTGVNVENASFSLTICAERAALVKMISEGELSFSEIAIVGDIKTLPMPCGACLQFMSEFAAKDTKVHVYNNTSETKTHTLKNLLPNPFGNFK